MGENPSRYKSLQRPVEQVSWEDCQRLIERLNGLIPGLESRLPNEAEWERACRAGTSTARWNGELEIVSGKSQLLDAIAWYGGNADTGEERGTRGVSQKQPNPWGLYDMLGNVWEWCRDGGRQYAAAAALDPEGPLDDPHRVIRGGSWLATARYMRAAYRRGLTPGPRHRDLGCRLSRGPGRGG